MTRAVKDAKLESATARRKHCQGGAIFWRSLDPGLHLGYRCNASGGRWLARWRVGQSYEQVVLKVVTDDLGDADGYAVLNFAQAQAAVRELFAATKIPAAPITVRAACDSYVTYLKAERKATTARNAESMFRIHVMPPLGDKLVAELKKAEIDKMKRAMVRAEPESVARIRRSKATANQMMCYLRAALTDAFNEMTNNIPSEKAWRTSENYPGARGKLQVVMLEPEQEQRLINVAQGSFRNLVIATLLTGARPPHELAGCRVRDFSASLGQLHVDGKTGPRDVLLRPKAVSFFIGLTAGRSPEALLLPKDNGEPWRGVDHAWPMKQAAKKAGLPLTEDGHLFPIYGLRHVHAAKAITQGANLFLLAENMGTSVRMLELHYGSIIKSRQRALIDAGIPDLDFPLPNSAGGNVARIKG